MENCLSPFSTTSLTISPPDNKQSQVYPSKFAIKTNTPVIGRGGVQFSNLAVSKGNSYGGGGGERGGMGDGYGTKDDDNRSYMSAAGEMNENRSYASIKSGYSSVQDLNYRLLTDDPEFISRFQMLDQWIKRYEAMTKTVTDITNAKNTLYFVEKKAYTDKRDAALVYSEYIRQQSTRGFIPDYANHIEDRHIWLTPKIHGQDGLMHKTASGGTSVAVFTPLLSDTTNKNNTAMQIWGSNRHYGQGVIPYSDELKGDYTNTYVLGVHIGAIHNSTGYPIGITIYHDEIITSPNSQPRLNAVELKGLHHCSPQANKKFHYIIPPGDSSEDKVIYLADESINNQYGVDYPWITSNYDTLKAKTQVFGSTHLIVPMDHPIFKYYVENMCYHPRWEFPNESPHTSELMVKGVLIHKDIAEHIISKIQNIVRNELCVVDLSTLKVRHEIIGYNSSLELAKAERKGFDKQRDDAADALSYRLRVDYMFRKKYDAATEEDNTPLDYGEGQNGYIE